MKTVKFIKFFALVLILSFSNVATYAQNEEDTLSFVDLFDMDLEQLMKLEVVSSTKSSQKVSEAPNIISVYSRNQIVSYGWNSINDILYKHQGFFPSQDYDRRTVGFRGNFEGWNNNHLLLLVDGVPFNDNLYGSAYTWEITPLVFSKSFEIIRGPGAALYGTNANNGVFTMNTLSYKDLGEKHVIVSAKYGENQTHNYDIVTGFSTKKFSNVTSLSFYKTDGVDYLTYDGSYDTLANGTLAKFNVKDQHYNGYFFTKFEGEGNLKGLNVQFHHQQWDYETGHGWLWQIPTQNETMKESRQIAMIKYSKKLLDFIESEYVVKYQIHNIDWDMRYYRENSFGGYYPDGVSEYLKTSGQDVFARIQFKFTLPDNSSILTAIENTTFLYTGDKEHFTNTDLTDAGGFEMEDGTLVPPFEGWWAPYPNNENRDLEPWFEAVVNKPVNNLAFFVQYASNKFVNDLIQFTAGVRFDTEFFKYIDIYAPNKPLKNKNFQEFSPRFAIILMPKENFSVKIMGGTAFRAPAPTEMFGANTWTLASNLEELQPERIKTAEIAFDYQINKNIVARLNYFYTISKGQIAYSIGNNNLSTNIYDLTNTGVESEIQFISSTFFGFLNASYVTRVDENIYEKEQEWVSVHKFRLTWGPAITANTGVGYTHKNFTATILGHYQGEVLRRDLDLYSADEISAMNLIESPRPVSIAPWFSLDSKIAYRIRFVEFGFSGTNLLNTTNYLIKNLKYPFDYQMQGRVILFNALLTF